MKPWNVLSITLFLLNAGSALAAEEKPEKLTGADAAHIDWATTNCQVKSTVKEHRLADAANATANPAFEKTFAEESRKLAAVQRDRDQADLCGQIKYWYGPGGSKVAGLIEWSSGGPGTRVGGASSGGGGGGGKRGH